MELVSVVNRTDRLISATWDGKPYSIKASSTEAFPATVAVAFKRQNPIKGTQDPRFLTCQYYVGVKEWGDEVSPVEISTAIELLPSEVLRGGAKPLEVPARGGAFAADMGPGLGSGNGLASSGFVDANR